MKLSSARGKGMDTAVHVYAPHRVRNPASGRVLAKIGMKREGLLRQHVRKLEVFEDVALLPLLRQDWVKPSQG